MLTKAQIEIIDDLAAQECELDSRPFYTGAMSLMSWRLEAHEAGDTVLTEFFDSLMTDLSAWDKACDVYETSYHCYKENGKLC